MVDSICNFLINRIRKEMPDIDDQRAEVIKYGLENIIGELPKTILLFGIAFLFGILNLTLISFASIIVYRAFSGGFHAKTHIGCILTTCLLYMGNVFISQNMLYTDPVVKYILVGAVWVFSLVMITLYAPADTENVPILRKKDRRTKKILSYISMTITLAISLFVQDIVISNIIIYGVLLQTITITRFAYIITGNKYGHEVYAKNS